MKKLIYTGICLSIIFLGIKQRETKIETKVIEKEFAHESVAKLDALYKNIINPIEENVGKIYITSIWRPYKWSQHSRWEAVDIDNDVIHSVSNRDIYRFVKNHMEFDQLIVYRSLDRPTHLHISHKEVGNRNEVFLAKEYWRKGRKRTYYKKIN